MENAMEIGLLSQAPEERIDMLEQIIRSYNEAIFDTDREQALKVIHDAVAKGVTPEDVVFKIVIPAIEHMVKAISEDFDANLAQHFMTSQIAAEVTEEMLAKFKTAPEIVGRVVIGTAEEPAEQGTSTLRMRMF